MLLNQFGVGRLVAVTFSLLIAASSQAQLQIEDGYVRGLPPGQTVTAAFMRLVNTSDTPVEITAAETDSAERAEIHAHFHRNGMMRMGQVASITVPANGEFTLAPGGHHLMLIGLLKPLRDGDPVVIKLHDKLGSLTTVRLPVRSVLREHHKH